MGFLVYDLQEVAKIVALDYDYLIFLLERDGLIWKSQKGYKPYRKAIRSGFFVLKETTNYFGKKAYDTKATVDGIKFIKETYCTCNSDGCDC